MRLASEAFLKVAVGGANQRQRHFGVNSVQNPLKPLMHQASAAFLKVAVCSATPLRERFEVKSP
jgi:hypothetical protein